ncbi:MAG TPA: hypothetical protein EYN66_03310, partial [Myxococcales bacterium]|nr:hypothetical protein [Myxococcales bacterium]
TEALRKIGEAAVEPLIKALEDDDIDIRRATAKALEKLGWKPDLRYGPHIANLIAKQDWEGCIKLGEPAVLPLIKVLEGDDWETCVSAAEALAEIGDERSVEPLIKVLARRESDKFATSRRNQRSAAIKALKKFGDKRAVKPLSELLDDKMGCIARDAAEALGDIGDVHAVEPLIKALGNDDLGVRDVVAKALDKLKWKPDTDGLRAAYLIAKQDWEECIKLGEPAVLPLIKILRFETGAPPNVAYENLWGKPRRAYRDLSVNVANESVIESLGPLRPSYQAALALGKIGDVRAVEALIEALGVTNFHSRLREELKDSDINKAAAEALWELGEDAVESLIKALGNDDADIRQTTDKFLTTKFLKAVLKERGLPISGTKAALIQRLKSVKVDDTGGNQTTHQGP